MRLLFNRKALHKALIEAGPPPAKAPTTVYNISAPIEQEQHRPCWIRGQKAIFHRWVNSAHPVLPRGEEPSESSRYYQFRRTEGLVEYEDGTMARVYPTTIRFADGGGFDKYKWLPLDETEKEGTAYE